MANLFYTSHSGKRIDLNCREIAFGQALKLRGGAWNINLGMHQLKNAYRSARSFTTSVVFRDFEAAKDALDIFDSDVSSMQPGTFETNGWSQRGYVVSDTPTKFGKNFARITIEIILLDGVWRKPETLTLFSMSGDADGTKVYDYLYPYVYASKMGVRYVDIKDASPAPFEMRIYGYAVSPQITIGANVYQFDTTIPAGGYLLVDTRDDPTVTLVLADGAKIDAFDCAKRGTGEGCGHYAFEKLQPGRSAIRWSDMYGVDLVIWHETGRPDYED